MICFIEFGLFSKSTLACVSWCVQSNASDFKNVYLKLEVKMLLNTIMFCIFSKVVFRNGSLLALWESCAGKARKRHHLLCETAAGKERALLWGWEMTRSAYMSQGGLIWETGRRNR